MYSLRLTKVPEDGSMTEPGLELGLKELGLAEPFTAAPVKVSYTLSRMFEKVYGKVKASATVHQTCGRCLKDFEHAVQADFTVMFEPRPTSAPREVDVDAEADDTAVSYLEGEEIPLGDEIRQELELQVPYAPVCRRNCKGLCLVC